MSAIMTRRNVKMFNAHDRLFQVFSTQIFFPQAFSMCSSCKYKAGCTLACTCVTWKNPPDTSLPSPPPTYTQHLSLDLATLHMQRPSAGWGALDSLVNPETSRSYSQAQMKRDSIVNRWNTGNLPAETTSRGPEGKLSWITEEEPSAGGNRICQLPSLV